MLVKALDTLTEVITRGRERCWWTWVSEQVEELVENQCDLIRGQRCCDGCVVWKKFNSVRNADGFGCRNVTLVVTVMLVGWPNIETIGTVGRPGCTFVCSVVNHYFAACWGQGGVTEIEIAIDLSIRQDGRVDTGRP